MYSSLDIDTVAAVAASEFLNSDIDLFLDVEELGLYLALTKDSRELADMGLKDVCHTRTHTRGQKPGITTEEVLNRTEKTRSKFVKPVRTPTKEEAKKMFSVALETLIKVAMKSHLYTFNKDILQQLKGGAIGNTLTGALACLYMLFWARSFKEKVLEATIMMPVFHLWLCKVYVDDGNMATSALPPGARLMEDGIIRVVEDKVVSDLAIPTDIRTSEIIKDIGNTISPFIKLTVDCPSLNPSLDCWMPLLDLCVRIEDNTIVYKFYKKAVSNPVLMRQDSAMPDRIKRNALVQEGMRRLRNTKRELPWELKVEILSEFSHKLMVSGYNDRFRYEVISAAVIGYERQCERADSGGTPLHRPWSYEREARTKKKLMTKTTWYRPADCVGFIPATPDSVLAKRIQAVVSQDAARLGLTVKIIETGGVSLARSLIKNDLTGCVYHETCYLCEGGLKGGSHTRRGPVYQGVCTVCETNNIIATYEGECGDSGVARAGEHRDAIANNDEKNAFAKHISNFHPERAGDKSVIKMKVVKTFKKCLERQVSEATAIHHNKRDILLNSKAEFHQPSVARVTVSRNLGS